jgi:hypothetical protein
MKGVLLMKRIKHLTDESIMMYLDKELGQCEIESVKNHLSICEQCRLKLERYNRLYSGLQEWITPELPSGFTDSVMARLPETIFRKSYSPWVMIAVLGAVFSLIFAFALIQSPLIIKGILDVTFLAPAPVLNVLFTVTKNVLSGGADLLDLIFKVGILITKLTVKTTFGVFLKNQAVFVLLAVVYVTLQRFLINYLAVQKR